MTNKCSVCEEEKDNSEIVVRNLMEGKFVMCKTCMQSMPRCVVCGKGFREKCDCFVNSKIGMPPAEVKVGQLKNRNALEKGLMAFAQVGLTEEQQQAFLKAATELALSQNNNNYHH